MKTSIKTYNIRIGMGLLFAGLFLIPSAFAQTAEERIAELERRIESLTRDVERTTLAEILGPGEVDDTFSTPGGMPFGASKVYQRESGLSIGGYGEGRYQNFDDGDDQADFLRAIIYAGYKYSDKWVFNSEIEFEHASTSVEGSASVEFAYLEYEHRPELRFRSGLLLVPMGFINELHEPTLFPSTRRPESERRIIPSTWRENGLGILGDVGPFSYKAFIVNGLRGENFSGSGLRGGRQKGSEAIANDLAVVGRLDYSIPGFTAGISAYTGDSGQDIGIGLGTTIFDVHADYTIRGLNLRGVYTMADVDDTLAFNQRAAAEAETDISDVNALGSELSGWYLQAGYDLLNTVDSGEQRLTPFIRYEEINTQDGLEGGLTASGNNDREILTLGINYQPLDEVIFKADFIQDDNAAGGSKEQWNLGMGYLF